MGIGRERLNALVTAIRQAPGHAITIGCKLAFSNKSIARWISNSLAQGKVPIIIVMIGRLGDIIACTPIPHQLKKSNPNSSIAWVCSSRYSGSLCTNPYIDAVFCEESITCWSITKRKLPQSFICYELFLDNQRCDWTGYKPRKPPSGINNYNYLNTGRNLLLAYSHASGIGAIENIEPELFPPGTNKHFMPRPTMAIHFDSEDKDRRLPDSAAKEFVVAALEKGWNMVEFGTNPIASKHSDEIFFPGENTSLPEQIAIFRNCDYFCGVDSAFLHVANAFRIPSTLLLGKFRHFEKFETFSGNFFHSAFCKIFRGDKSINATQFSEYEHLIPDTVEVIK